MHIIRRAALTAAATALIGAAAPSHAGPAYITVGEAAHALLAEVAPQAREHSAADVPVMLPAARGSRALAAGRERVRVVEIDEARLPALSQAVHERLHRCGGFVHHDSLAEALATLHRLQQPAAGAATPSYAIDDSSTVTPLLAQMQDSQILATIERLSQFQNRYYTSSHGQAASDWLASTWRSLAGGRTDVQVTQVQHRGWPQKSVSLLIRGSVKPQERIVLGGHLDSIASPAGNEVRAPGADDDASGVATLTEVIRVLMAANFRPTRSVEFIAYAAEEVGLRGSAQIAARYARQKQAVLGVLQLDMTAYQGDATDLWIFTDYTHAAQNQFVADLAAQYLPELTVGFDRCGYACSDHASWTQRGFAASFPFEASDAHYNKAIHTAADTTATFGNHARHALKFGKLALSYAVELGSD